MTLDFLYDNAWFKEFSVSMFPIELQFQRSLGPLPVAVPSIILTVEINQMEEESQTLYKTGFYMQCV